MPLWADDADGNGEYEIGAVFADDADGNGEYEIGAVYADDADGNGEYLVWEDVWVEDFEHNDLAGRYTHVGTTSPLEINQRFPYVGDYSLEIPDSSDGGQVYANTGKFATTAGPGESYRIYYYIEDTGNSNIVVRFYMGTNGDQPSSSGGYDILLGGSNDEFRVESWDSSGTQVGSDSGAYSGSITKSQWDYFEVSYDNADDAGADTFAVDWVRGGTVVATRSVSTSTATDEWGWHKPWGWETHHIGGLEQR